MGQRVPKKVPETKEKECVGLNMFIFMCDSGILLLYVNYSLTVALHKKNSHPLHKMVSTNTTCPLGRLDSLGA